MKGFTLIGGQHGGLNDWLRIWRSHSRTMAIHLVDMAAEDRIVAASLRTHSAMCVHVGSRMVLLESKKKAIRYRKSHTTMMHR